MKFVEFMTSTWGRLLRVVAGLVLVYVGYMVPGAWGIVLMVVGAIVFLAGVLNYCLFAPFFGAPFWTKR